MNPRRPALLTCALALATATACSTVPPGGDQVTGTAADLATTTAPASHGVDRITWNLPYEPQTLDPIRSFNYAENTALANMCESLLRLTPDLKIRPGLAEKAENPTPTRWVYTLRKDVRFWDGHPMTAADVAASLNRHLDPAQGTWWSDYFQTVASIRATGPYRVTVDLKQPDVLFNQAMATAAGAVVEKSFLRTAGQSLGSPTGGLMCTGPFRFAGWKPGDFLRLTRNDTYWDRTLRATSRSLVFRFIADETTAVNALRSGEVDGQYFYLPPAGLSQLRASRTGSVTLGRSLTFWTLLGAATSGPYADPRVREALAAALDRPGIARVIFQGAAAPESTLANADYWGYSPDVFRSAHDALPGARPDPARARRLLHDAGPPSHALTIGIQGSSAVHEQTASIIKAAGEDLGLRIRIKVIPVEQYGNLYSDPKARQGIDAFLSTWYGNMPDPLDVYRVFTKGGRSNFDDYAAVDGPVRQAQAAYAPRERAALVGAIQATVSRDAPWTPIASLPVILYMNKRITGAVASFSYLYYPWAAGIGAP
ncbi:peptide ABC transporter substrate-binding protein [Streptomyces sp. Ru71]|uniref:ABC transporter substrate-binding protein n=1 Tax=Streptomyces sp. Ru71 TaxID=2080746 RepID=UPI000CDE54FC|nr:ABC transporter substrate-binding protein [Streptomyces sp. Ru71]POX48526.1 peptide ABC transporter substrate-binding protein [Streptomyces sp. Ru71]